MTRDALAAVLRDMRVRPHGRDYDIETGSHATVFMRARVRSNASRVEKGEETY